MVTSARWVLGTLIGVTLLSAPGRTAEPDTDSKKADNKLVGSWKCISAKYGGKDAPRPEGYTHVKHVTPTQFMWAIYDAEGKVSTVLGGSIKIKGDEYVETPEYGTEDVLAQLKGKPQEFNWKIEGNKWHHTGKLSTGLTIEEVWERVEKK
jgi:hypothetical protein